MNLLLKKNLIMFSNQGYLVYVEEYAKSHFIKSFSKRYGAARDKTLTAILGMLQYIDGLLLTSKAEKIHSADCLHILKCEFTIAGSNQSPHGSGNRYIVYMDQKNRKCHILLVYAKTDIKGTNETARWRGEIKKNYPDFIGKFTGI